MITCERAALLNAPAQEVFQAFVGPAERLKLMGDYVSRIECSGNGIGAVYSMWLDSENGPACVKEVTVGFDSSRHSMEVVMTDTGGIVPFGNYRAQLDVQDAGPGISPAAATKLFDPFYTTKPVGKGTGLGLSISYGLAMDLGGSLQAVNHPQGGAVFTLSLPIRGNGHD